MQGFSLPARPIVDSVVPNPKLKLLDQVSEVMRVKHYAIRTETALLSEHRTSNIEH